MSTYLRVKYYEREDGSCPIEKGLARLEKERPKEVLKVQDKLRIIEQIGYREACKIGLLVPVTGTRKIVEVKIKGTDIRLLGFIGSRREGDLVFLLAAFDQKKRWRLKPSVIEVAKRAYEDWERRLR